MKFLPTVLTLFLLPSLLLSAPLSFSEERNTNDPARLLVVRLQLDADEIKLSGEMKLTLVAEGPGPLELSTGKSLLDGPLSWRVREDTPFPRELLPGGRERITKTYRLSPLVPGSVIITLNPLRCRTGTDPEATIAFKPCTVQVTTSAGVAGIDSLRPNTGIEHVQEDTRKEVVSVWWILIILPGILGIVVWILRRRRPVIGTPMNFGRLLLELAEPGLDTERLSQIVREYLAFRFAIPTRQTTTPELIDRLRNEFSLSAGTVDLLEWTFRAIDSERFSGNLYVADGTIDKIRETVRQIEEEYQNFSPAERRTDSGDSPTPDPEK